MNKEHVRMIITEQFLAEREKQDSPEYGEDTKHLNKFYIGHPDMYWTVTLSEKVGDVAKAVSEKDTSKLYNQLIQCGATCMAWAEGIQKRNIDRRIENDEELQ